MSGIGGREQSSKTFSPVAGRSWAQQHPIIQAPSLHQAVGPDGSLVYVKVPFTTSDLMSWKESVRSYRDDPDRTYQSSKMIVKDHNSGW